MADNEAAAPEAGDAGSGGKKKLAIVGLVAFLVGSGAGIGGAMFMGGGGSGGDEALAEQGEATDGESPVATKATRQVIQMADFTINLRGTGGGRVLRLEMAAEVDDADASVVETRMPVLRDAVLTLASDYTYNDLEGLDGKMRLRDELLARLNTSLEQEAKVQRVYFTNFVVQ